MRPGCPRCGSGEVALTLRNLDHISGETFRVLRCGACGLGRTDPVPADLTPYYSTRYYGRGGVRFNPVVEALVRAARGARAAAIAARRPAGDVLDVGCGRGLMLAQLRARGWRPMGVETSAEASEHARTALALEVRVAPQLAASGLPSQSFDAVTFYHVLEHLADPQDALREAARLLRPGGLVVVEVPNLDSWQARLGGGRWFHLDTPRHRFHFGPRQLGEALTEAGFEVDSWSTHSFEFGYFGMVQSLLNRSTRRMNVLYDLLKNATAGERRLDRDSAVSLLLAGPAAAAGVPLEAVGAAAGRGGVLRVYASKP